MKVSKRRGRIKMRIDVYQSQDLALKRIIDHLYFDVSQAFMNQSIYYTDLPRVIKIVCEECERVNFPVRVDKKDLVMKMMYMLIKQRTGDRYVKTCFDYIGETLIDEYISISKGETWIGRRRYSLRKRPERLTQFYKNK